MSERVRFSCSGFLRSRSGWLLHDSEGHKLLTISIAVAWEFFWLNGSGLLQCSRLVAISYVRKVMPMWNNLVQCSEQGLFSSQVFCLTMLRRFPLRSGHYRRVPQYDDIPDWAGDFVRLGLVMYIIESNWITLTLTGNMSHPLSHLYLFVHIDWGWLIFSTRKRRHVSLGSPHLPCEFGNAGMLGCRDLLGSQQLQSLVASRTCRVVDYGPGRRKEEREVKRMKSVGQNSCCEVSSRFWPLKTDENYLQVLLPSYGWRKLRHLQFGVAAVPAPKTWGWRQRPCELPRTIREKWMFNHVRSHWPWLSNWETERDLEWLVRL